MIEFVQLVDKSVLEMLYSTRSMFGLYTLIGITELGSVMFIGGSTLAIGLWLFLKSKYFDLVAFWLAVFTTSASVWLLKHFFLRARPDSFYQAYPESGYALPSGHAAHAAVFYSFVSYLLIRYLPQYQNIVITISTFIILAVGFSRLYLGVHYLSDVFFGYAIGFACAYLGTKISRKEYAFLRRK
ncbi:MAG: hypothetical protein RIQ56_492 [Candidatus Parcubacteria bacterium]|jgi:undecaprenyl-diphosphatase